MENLRDVALTSGTATLHPLLSPGQVQLSKVMDGSSWLHVQVCLDFLRGTCTFSETQCNFAHPQPHIKVRNNHINACYDNIKGTCNRVRPPCKYFHPPDHIKEELVVAGRQHLALKKALIQKMAACDPGQPFITEEVFEGETKSCKPEIAMPNVQKREPEEESENKLNTKRCRYVEPSKKRMKEFIDQNPVEMGDTMSLVRVVSALLRRGNSSLMFKTPESLCTNVPMKNAPLCFGTKVDEGQVEIFTGKESTVAPAIKNAFKAFQNFVKTSGKPLWDPRTSTGFWQGVSLRCNSAGEVMLHATVMGSSTAESKEIMEELTPKLTQFFSWGRGQPSKVITIGISIVPDEEDVPHLVMGKGYLDEVVMNMRLRLFRQTFMWNSHTGMNDVCEILAKICSSQRIFQVLQLGCNPGLFGHYLARYVAEKLLMFPRWTTCVWSKPDALPTDVFSDATPWTTASLAPYRGECRIQRFAAPEEINKAEVAAALITWLWEYQSTGSRVIRLGTDNTTVLNNAARGRGLIFAGADMCHLHFLVAHTLRHCWYEAYWVPSESNPADRPSREVLQQVLDQERDTAAVIAWETIPRDPLVLLYR
uniref:(California timema) hypothetical protein n=1 Tax=Timema californicum TaxID=61474 RepID=A0A7R9P6T7_TIMCA|nr:unnamed protein product [Timema californicum]